MAAPRPLPANLERFRERFMAKTAVAGTIPLQSEASMNTPTPMPGTAEAKLLRELSAVVCDFLGGGSEWFTRIGDEFYVDPRIVGPELRRRKTDAQITKKALIRANRKAAETTGDLVEVLRACLAREADRAPNPGDCSCIFLSRQGEREYETGTCPHQRARALLAKVQP